MWRYSEAEAKKNVLKEVETMPDIESGIDHEVIEEIDDRREMDEQGDEAAVTERARRGSPSGSEPDR